MWMVQFILFVPKPFKFYIYATSIDTIHTNTFIRAHRTCIHYVPAAITVNKHMCYFILHCLPLWWWWWSPWEKLAQIAPYLCFVIHLFIYPLSHWEWINFNSFLCHCVCRWVLILYMKYSTWKISNLFVSEYTILSSILFGLVWSFYYRIRAENHSSNIALFLVIYLDFS